MSTTKINPHLQSQELELALKAVPAAIINKIFANNKITYIYIMYITHKHIETRDH